MSWGQDTAASSKHICQDNIGDSLHQKVVMELSKHILGKGYTIYLDNWYSSTNLFLNFLKNYMNGIETVWEKKKKHAKRTFKN